MRQVTITIPNAPKDAPSLTKTPKRLMDIVSFQHEWYAPSPALAGPRHRMAWAALEGAKPASGESKRKQTLRQKLEKAIRTSDHLEYQSISASSPVGQVKDGQAVFYRPSVRAEFVGKGGSLGYVDLPKAAKRMW